MDKKDVAHLLDQIAAFLELKGENAFRIRAYHNASRAVSHFHGDLGVALQSGELAEVPGIGPATLDIVAQALESGHSTVLEELRREIPPGLVEMMKVSGLGVAKIRQIHSSLKITTPAELEVAARDGRLAQLPRFGAKTAEKILKGLEYLKKVDEFKLYTHGRSEAETLSHTIGDLTGVSRVEVAGSVRRVNELIRDLDFVIQLAGSPTSLTDQLAHLPGVIEFTGQPDEGYRVRFASDIFADLYLAGEDQFGFELLMATGNAAHLEGLQQRATALGYTWTARGIERDGKLVPATTEHAVYTMLDMSYVEPELREGTDEIERAVAGTLPTLVDRNDVKGFLHCHSNYSDGTSTVHDWAIAARKAGYAYVGITDHSAAALYAGGLYTESIKTQHAEIDQVNRKVDGVRVLKGVEVDILESGDLDYDDATQASFDFIIASVHNRFGQTSEQMTKRILRAMDNPHMAILGHPTGRLLLSRDPYPMDLPTILDRAAARGVAVEINADPRRLDLDWRMVREAVRRGVMISLGADAHSTAGMSNMDVGISLARKGWLVADQVLNTRSLDDFLAIVNARRTRR